jgi:Peptidase A4 family
MRLRKVLACSALFVFGFGGATLAWGQAASGPSARPVDVPSGTLASGFAQIAAIAARSGPPAVTLLQGPDGHVPAIFNPGTQGATAQSSEACSQPGDACSTNWAGLEAYKDTFSGLEAEWVVPAVTPTSSSPEDSSTWVGIDGDPAFDGSSPPLIQIGTDSPSGLNGGGPIVYEAWMEMLPGAEQPLFDVEPGDQIKADLDETSPGVWDVGIADLTQNLAYASSGVDYSAPGASAEWVEEASTICAGPLGCHPSQLQDFGSVSFSNWGYSDAGAGSAYAQSDYLVDATGDVLAAPSWDGHAITVTYVPPATGTTTSTSPGPTLSGWGPVSTPGFSVLPGSAGAAGPPVTCTPGGAHCVAALSSSSVVTDDGQLGEGVVVTSDLANWYQYDSLPSDLVSVYGLACPSASVCVAVGAGALGGPVVALSADGGVTWSDAAVPGGGGLPGWLRSVACPTAQVCLAVGGSTAPFAPNLVRTVDGGRDWSVGDAALPAGHYDLDGVSCSSSLACVAVGSSSPSGPAVALRTTDGGNHWAASSSGALSELSGLAAVSCPPAAGTCYGAGSPLASGGPALVLSNDGGLSWTPSSAGPAGVSLSGVSCADSQTCWMAGAGTDLALAETGDGGATFTSLTGPATGELGTVACASALDCIATAEGRLWATTGNGGLAPDRPAPTTTTSPAPGGPGGGGGPLPPLTTTTGPAAKSTTTNPTATTTTTAAPTTTTTIATRGVRSRVTTTTSPRRVPRVTIVSAPSQHVRGQFTVRLRCAIAACHGWAEVALRPKGRGHSAPAARISAGQVIAKSAYSSASGRTVTLRLHLTRAGSHRVGQAHGLPAVCLVTVHGGRSVSRAFTVR